MDNENHTAKICTTLNDIEMIVSDISIKLEVLNIYIEEKTNTSDTANGASFIIDNINSDYKKLTEVIDENNKLIFKLLKNL